MDSVTARNCVKDNSIKIALTAITNGGCKLARNIAGQIDAVFLEKKDEKFSKHIAYVWNNYDAIICIMATGVVVRSIAPLLQDKTTDPCIIVLDEKGSNVISLLSGHLGGGNALTLRIAELIGANPVITTASDTLERTAFDLWLKKYQIICPSRKELTTLSAKIVNNGMVQVYSEPLLLSDSLPLLPKDLQWTTQENDADCILSYKKEANSEKPQLFPQAIVIGIGCNRGTPIEEFESSLMEFLEKYNLARYSIRNLASIDAKNDEVGLLQFAQNNRWHIDFFHKDSINTIKNITISEAAMKAVGAVGVAEPTCLLSAKSNILLVRKQKWKNITMAAAMVKLAPFML